MAEDVPLRDTVCVGCALARPAAVSFAGYVRCGWDPGGVPYWHELHITEATRLRPVREWTGLPPRTCAVRA